MIVIHGTKTEVQSTTHRGDLVEGHCQRQNREVFGSKQHHSSPVMIQLTSLKYILN